MRQKFPQSSSAFRVFALILICLICGGAAMGQEGSGAGPVKPDTAITLQPPATAGGTDRAVPNGRATAPADIPNDYKTSLNALSTLYQSEVQRLEQKNNQSKELYNQGLISRVELEGSNKALADARAKVDEIAGQIAAANKPAPAANVVSELAASNHGWTTRNARVDSLIRYYGNQYGVDPYLIFCLMSQESNFTTSATSPRGAQGLMQLMPGTAARYGVSNPYDVAQSIMGGTRYLKDLLKMFNGRVDLALAGYNAGENAVIKHGYTVPPYEETRNYVRLIIARYGKKQTSSAPAPAL